MVLARPVCGRNSLENSRYDPDIVPVCFPRDILTTLICLVVHFQLLEVQMRVNGKYDRADQVAARGSIQIWRSVAR